MSRRVERPPELRAGASAGDGAAAMLADAPPTLGDAEALERRLKRQAGILAVVTRLHEGLLLGGEVRANFQRMLDHLLALTGSEYGFISEVLHDVAGKPFLRMHGLSNVAWNASSRATFERFHSGDFEFDNLDTLFGAVVRTQAPVISNTPREDHRSGGVPEGHPALKAFLGLPLRHSGQLLGIVGLANAPGGFDAALVDELEPLSATCASMILALRLEAERNRGELELRRRIAFERLVSRISSDLMPARPEALDAALERALRELGAFAGADRSYVFEITTDGKRLSNTHEWCAAGIEPQMELLQDLPFDGRMLFMRRIAAGDMVDFPDIAALPPEAEVDRLILQAQDIQSLLSVPMVADGEVIGFVGIDAVREKRQWSDDEKALMLLVASAFASALERRRADETLRVSEARYRSVVENVREVIFQADLDGRWVFLNQAWETITGHGLAESLGRSFRAFVHQEDQARHAEFFEDLVRGERHAGSLVLRLRRLGGDYRWVEVCVNSELDAAGGVKGFFGTLNDITLQKEHEAHLEYIAHYDALTGLPNRVLLHDRLQRSMVQCQRRGQMLAVAYIDLDGFKSVNDTHGHQVGDHLLTAVAARMKSCLREGDSVSRLGGDEFVAVMIDLADMSVCEQLVHRLLAAASCVVPVGELELKVSASIGLTLYPQGDEVDADQLLRQADQAMYEAKLLGKNRFHLFDAAHDRSLRGRHESIAEVHKALLAGEMRLVYQPKVNMATGEVLGVEALLRWAHPEHGVLEPNAFLPLVEEHPIAIEVGDWVIEQALAQIAHWKQQGLALPVSVNISARHLQAPDFMMRLHAVLARYPAVHPGSLELEVLETSALESIVQVSRIVEACSAIGVRFALDDFGTGYSSLAYLKRLPAARLKIDQMFVRGMLDDAEDLAILRAILGLASAFRREVIAEGVETEAHGRLLLALGCEVGQGYFIARPMPAADIPDWAANWSPPESWLLTPP